MIVLLFGPPGCGKGTQAAFITGRFRIPAISTGDVLRAEVKASTELGQAAAAVMAAGGLVGDDLINPMVANRLAQPDCADGFLLDGYPRTLAQVDFLTALLAERRLPAPTAIFIDVPDETIIERLTARRTCGTCLRIYNLQTQRPRVEDRCDACGNVLLIRADDAYETVFKRLAAYHRSTGMVIAFYRNAWRVDGTRTPADIGREIESILQPAADAASS